MRILRQQDGKRRIHQNWPVEAWCSSDFFNASSAASLRSHISVNEPVAICRVPNLTSLFPTSSRVVCGSHEAGTVWHSTATFLIYADGVTRGSRTPTALVADNDAALGQVIEAVSHSKFWTNTAIFVIEDDAQNGPDHADAHRTEALVISPYTRHGAVDSTLYSTTSMLRTIELILGLQPMTQFDAAATPMFNSFQAQADATAYVALPARVNLSARNTAQEWGGNENFNFVKEDANDTSSSTTSSGIPCEAAMFRCPRQFMPDSSGPAPTPRMTTIEIEWLTQFSTIAAARARGWLRRKSSLWERQAC
jgi:hypothetical protein